MDNNQHEQYEYARRRIKQKKRLYFHLIIFFMGSIFIFFDTIFLNFGESIPVLKSVILFMIIMFMLMSSKLEKYRITQI